MIYGDTASGLDATASAPDDYIHQNSQTMQGVAEADDEWGEVMPGEHVPDF